MDWYLQPERSKDGSHKNPCIYICVYIYIDMFLNYTGLCTHVLGPFPEALWAEVGGLLLWSSMSGLFVRLAGDPPKSFLGV